MNLGPAPLQYDAQDQSQIRGTLERTDKQNQKINSPIIIAAPNGSKWKLVVSNTGTLTTVAA